MRPRALGRGRCHFRASFVEDWCTKKGRRVRWTWGEGYDRDKGAARKKLGEVGEVVCVRGGVAKRSFYTYRHVCLRSPCIARVVGPFPSRKRATSAIEVGWYRIGAVDIGRSLTGGPRVVFAPFSVIAVINAVTPNPSIERPTLTNSSFQACSCYQFPHSISILFLLPSSRNANNRSGSRDSTGEISMATRYSELHS